MVAQHEVNWFLNDFLDCAEVVADITTLGDAATDRYSVRSLLDECKKIPQAIGVNEIQMDVSQPRKSH